MKEEVIGDGQLVSQYILGSEAAFEELVHRHKSRVYSTILVIVKDSAVAEDLLQDVFIKVINTMKAGKYNDQGKFLPWVLRIAHNLAIDHFRKNKRNPELHMEDQTRLGNVLGLSEENFEDRTVRHETHQALRAMIQELPEAQRQVLIMRHFMDMSFKDIAERTDVSINTALGRMRYALINLRKLMKQNVNVAYDRNFTE